MYCALPFYHNPYYGAARRAHWVVARPPKFTIPTRLYDLKVSNTAVSGIFRVSFKISGPDHMSLYISPNESFKLVQWSWTDKIPPSGLQWKNRDVHFVSFFYGNNDDTPFECSFDVIVYPSTYTGSLGTIGLVGQYMHQDDDKTPEYKEFIDNFPKWSAAYHWVSSYESFEFGN